MKNRIFTLCFLSLTVPAWAGTVALTWDDPSVAPNKSTSFAVCRLVPNTTTYEEIGRPTATNYTDATAPVGAVSYKVRGISAAGEMSDYSAPWAGTVPAPPTKPAAPTNLTGTVSAVTTMEATTEAAEPAAREQPPAIAPTPPPPPPDRGDAP